MSLKSSLLNSGMFFSPQVGVNIKTFHFLHLKNTIELLGLEITVEAFGEIAES